MKHTGRKAFQLKSICLISAWHSSSSWASRLSLLLCWLCSVCEWILFRISILCNTLVCVYAWFGNLFTYCALGCVLKFYCYLLLPMIDWGKLPNSTNKYCFAWIGSQYTSSLYLVRLHVLHIRQLCVQRQSERFASNKVHTNNFISSFVYLIPFIKTFPCSQYLCVVSRLLGSPPKTFGSHEIFVEFGAHKRVSRKDYQKLN